MNEVMFFPDSTKVTSYQEVNGCKITEQTQYPSDDALGRRVRYERFEVPGGEVRIGYTRFKDGHDEVECVELPGGTKVFNQVSYPDGHSTAERIEFSNGGTRFKSVTHADGRQTWEREVARCDGDGPIKS